MYKMKRGEKLENYQMFSVADLFTLKKHFESSNERVMYKLVPSQSYTLLTSLLSLEVIISVTGLDRDQISLL